MEQTIRIEASIKELFVGGGHRSSSLSIFLAHLVPGLLLPTEAWGVKVCSGSASFPGWYVCRCCMQKVHCFSTECGGNTRRQASTPGEEEGQRTTLLLLETIRFVMFGLLWLRGGQQVLDDGSIDAIDSPIACSPDINPIIMCCCSHHVPPQTVQELTDANPVMEGDPLGGRHILY